MGINHRRDFSQGHISKGDILKTFLMALSALALLGTAIPAKAGCIGTIHCTSTANGKQQCSC
jgi:hypothetical protein